MENLTCRICTEPIEREITGEGEPKDICDDPDCWLAYMLGQQGA